MISSAPRAPTWSASCAIASSRLPASLQDEFRRREQLLRSRQRGLPLNAVVHRLTFFAPGHSVFTLLRAIRLGLLESTSFSPFVRGGLTRTRSRGIVGRRRVRARRNQGRAGNSGPSHVRCSGLLAPSVERRLGWRHERAQDSGVRERVYLAEHAVLRLISGGLLCARHRSL